MTFTDSRIIDILKQGEAVTKLCREHAISNASFYKWRSKFGDIDAAQISWLKDIEDENRQLKQMLAAFISVWNTGHSKMLLKKNVSTSDKA